jgi:hypothetical protein
MGFKVRANLWMCACARVRAAKTGLAPRLLEDAVLPESSLCCLDVFRRRCEHVIDHVEDQSIQRSPARQQPPPVKNTP